MQSSVRNAVKLVRYWAASSADDARARDGCKRELPSAVFDPRTGRIVPDLANYQKGASMNLIRRAALGLALAVLVAPALAQSQSSTDVAARVEKVLKHHPVIDGHNDLPWELRDRFGSDF